MHKSDNFSNALSFYNYFIALNLQITQMGQKGKEILEMDVIEVIRDLNSAYADEWLLTINTFYMLK
jgi:hypothetical protein